MDDELAMLLLAVVSVPSFSGAKDPKPKSNASSSPSPVSQ
jgi:hypothetical protein